MPFHDQITLIGGDLRNAYMATILANKGFTVTTYAVPLYFSSNRCHKAGSLSEAISKSNFIIAPTPITRDNTTITSLDKYSDLTIDYLFESLTPSHFLAAGDITTNIKESLDANGIAYFDFLKDCNTARLNAISTAEGAITEAILNSPGNIHGSKCLILGCGRCGKVIATKCKALDALVSISCRNEDLATYCTLHSYNHFSLDKLKDNIKHYDYIFNTIPAPILTKEILLNVSKDTTIIDIASAPGGVDYDASNDLELNAANYLGLPGKFAPKASAEILANLVIRLIKERSDK